MSTEEPPQIRIDVPPELAAGVYANALLVWHSGYEFTLDFAVSQPAEPAVEGNAAVVPYLVVARVRIPLAVMFPGILQQLTAALDTYERTFGPIQQPNRLPPEEPG